jgi:hypothetical protein
MLDARAVRLLLVLGAVALGAPGCAHGLVDTGGDGSVDDATSLDGARDGASADSSVDAPRTDGAAPDGAAQDAAHGTDGGVADASTGCMDPGPAACETLANQLGDITGDEGSDTRTATGTQSTWYDIVVNEANWATVDIKAQITLVSAAGTNFDLYVYVPNSPSGHQCTTVTQSSTLGAGMTDQVHISWPDATLGANDSRDVRIEVRHVSGACSNSTPWTLTVVGNS